jgi:hypothetical protein
VEVTDGLFNTGIDFDQSYFDGGELWLGVTVKPDPEMTPRHELRSVPYALSLVPGARIIGSAPVALHAESTHTSGKGIRGYATATSGTNHGVVGESKSPDGYGGYFYNNVSGIGVYGKGGKYGGYFTTNQGGTSGFPPVHNAAVNAATTYDYSDGVYAHTSGDRSYGVRIDTSGDYSFGVRAETTGDNGGGVYAETAGDDSWGVRAYTTGDDSDGVYARTSGDRSSGVHAYTTGDDSEGVYARTSGDDSRAVYACSDKGYGVYGRGKYGGYFTTNQGGIEGWHPVHNAAVNATTTYDYSEGVHAYTTGDHSTGVHAETTGGSSTGVHAETTGDDSEGVYARTTGDRSDGVRAYTTGDDSEGVYANSDKSYGVYARSDSTDKAGVYARGKDRGADLILGGNADTGVGDDGRIYSDPAYASSDIVLVTNDCIRIDLDNDGNGEDADFEIYDKDDNLIFDVDNSGDVSYGGPNIAAFPRPAYDSGWVSIDKGSTKTLTHDLGENPDNYVVDMQFMSGSNGRNQIDYGSDVISPLIQRGVDWRELDGTQIKVHRYRQDDFAENVRVRIWVYK